MSRGTDVEGSEAGGAAAVREAARGILVTHGGLAVGLVDAVRRIAGLEPGVLEPLSNEGLSREELCEEIRRLVDGGPAVIFTDMDAGSCTVAARVTCRGHANAVVVSGVNLPMLLEFLFNRHRPLPELLSRLTQKGRSAVEVVEPDLDDHGDRPLSD